MTLGSVARALVQALAAHLLVSTVLSLAVAALWPVVAGRRAPASVVITRITRIIKQVYGINH